jgi:hypothetical protein
VIERPLRGIAAMLIGLAGLPAVLTATGLSAAGRPDWALGVIVGWFAGSLNAGLLAVRVSRLTAHSTVAGFLYSAASRFALVGGLAVASYRWLGAYPVGFAIGIAFVLLMNVPVSLLWSMRQESMQ